MEACLASSSFSTQSTALVGSLPSGKAAVLSDSSFLSSSSFYSCRCRRSSFLFSSLTQPLVLRNHGKELTRKDTQSSATFSAGAVTAVLNKQDVRHARRVRRPENVEGDFFVDHTCIDCDTCRWMAPDIFTRVGSMSAVKKQPESAEARMLALQALVACPTSSIRTEVPAPEIQDVLQSFPIPIDSDTLPGVYHCGFHSRKSYGATSYFVVRPSGGNVLIDSPRFSEFLAEKIESLGGVQYMVMTHQDDVADHERWHHRFRAVRLMHENDIGPDTMDIEMKLQGTGPWSLGSDMDIHFTPGHTSGCVSILYKPHQALFTGDHLCYSAKQQRLSMMRNVNWFSVPHQIQSLKALLSLDFVWLLPGHGRRYQFKDNAHKNEELNALIALESSY